MLRRQLITMMEGGPTKQYWVEREHSFNDQTSVAVSQLLLCPRCAMMWASLQMEGDELLWPFPQTCKFCSVKDDWMPVPGSLLLEVGWGIIDDSLLAALPEELLRREFDLHMRAYSG